MDGFRTLGFDKERGKGGALPFGRARVALRIHLRGTMGTRLHCRRSGQENNLTKRFLTIT